MDVRAFGARRLWVTAKQGKQREDGIREIALSFWVAVAAKKLGKQRPVHVARTREDIGGAGELLISPGANKSQGS